MVCLSSMAQKKIVKQLPDSNYVQKVDTVSVLPPKDTGKNYTDLDGNVYPVFVTQTGKHFVVVKNKKTGQYRRFYLD